MEIGKREYKGILVRKINGEFLAEISDGICETAKGVEVKLISMLEEYTVDDLVEELKSRGAECIDGLEYWQLRMKKE